MKAEFMDSKSVIGSTGALTSAQQATEEKIGNSSIALSMKRYLTKSRFKLAMECPPKLFYCNKPNEYADAKQDDPFLAALAEGGFQVGELAKFLFCDDPIAERITIEEKDYDQAIMLTNEKLFGTEKPVIAEAAFRFENLFIRVDITTRQERVINIYEVKAKSWKDSKSFWKFNKRGERWLDKKYLHYLYDIAFQKYVVQKACPTYEVKAHLIFADADVAATINGLNQVFRIDKAGDNKKIKVVEGTTKLSLGTIPLRILPVDEICDWIHKNPVEVDLEGEFSFEKIIHLFSEAYQNDQRIWSHIGRKCKDCQFTNAADGPHMKSGFIECWKHWTNLTNEQLKMPLALELWGGGAGAISIVDNAIKRSKYLLESLQNTDWPQRKDDRIGLHSSERRQLQVDKIRNKDKTPYLDKEGLRNIFDELEPPYHFIDFETSMVALPFHSGRKPYEATAFQYSYHLMDEKGNIAHKNEYISLSKEFPNYEFVRALKNDLHGIKGTIFRYHNHENTYLNHIYKQLIQEPAGAISDRDDLIDFIREISHCSDKEGGWHGPCDMQDLWQLVLSYYYSPAAKGSNSIKDILPAVIRDSNFIRNKYSQPIYGTDLIPSLNFKNHTWISEQFQMNPYKTLPAILDGYSNDSFDQFFEMDEELRDGGAAMMAYAYLQFADIHPEQNELIRKALLRYCELDTMAMVMIWEYWGNEIGLFK